MAADFWPLAAGCCRSPWLAWVVPPRRRTRKRWSLAVIFIFLVAWPASPVFAKGPCGSGVRYITDIGAVNPAPSDKSILVRRRLMITALLLGAVSVGKALLLFRLTVCLLTLPPPLSVSSPETQSGVDACRPNGWTDLQREDRGRKKGVNMDTSPGKKKKEKREKRKSSRQATCLRK